MGKRKRIHIQYHDPLPGVVVPKFGFVEVDKITEGWKFQNSIDKRSYVHFERAKLEINKSMEDHITILPDEVVQIIISRLTMREGACTSILSSGWRNHWSSSVSCLNFDIANMTGYDNPNKRLKLKTRFLLRKKRCIFINWVDQILQHRQAEKMDALRVSYFLGRESTFSIDRWVKLAVAQGVRELDLDMSFSLYWISFEYKMMYKFPLWIFAHGDGSALTHLHLNSCILKPPPDFKGLNSLLSLSLKSTWLTAKGVRIILSNCSFLEWFSIRNCFGPGPTSLEFVGPSLRLKHLSISDFFLLLGIKVEAANLVSFEYKGPQVRLAFKNVPRVVRLHRGFSYPVNLKGIAYGLSELQNYFPRLETLLLSRDPGKETILPPNLPAFTNLKRLMFDITTTATKNLLELTSLLEACPVLQKLELDVCVIPEPDMPTEMETVVTEKRQCSHSNLKEIEMYGFGGYQNEIELAKCLLKIATTLEKMEIHVGVPWYYIGNGEWKRLEGIVGRTGISLKEVGNLLKKEVRSTTRFIISSPH